MKGKNQISIGMFILLIYTGLFLISPSMANAEPQYNQEYEESLKTPGIYNKMITYFHKERKTIHFLKLELKDIIVVNAVDLFLSLFCLWITIAALTGMKRFSFKKYGWFLYISNLSWVITLFALKLFWNGLESLTIKLQPDIEIPVLDTFTVFVIITAVLIYIWLLARTFQLNFFDASGTFLISHLLYFSLIFILLFTLSVILKEGHSLNLGKENLGIKLIIQSYLSDVYKITTDSSIWNFIRVKWFHF